MVVLGIWPAEEACLIRCLDVVRVVRFRHFSGVGIKDQRGRRPPWGEVERPAHIPARASDWPSSGSMSTTRGGQKSVDARSFRPCIERRFSSKVRRHRIAREIPIGRALLLEDDDDGLNRCGRRHTKISCDRGIAKEAAAAECRVVDRLVNPAEALPSKHKGLQSLRFFHVMGRTRPETDCMRFSPTWKIRAKNQFHSQRSVISKRPGGSTAAVRLKPPCFC